MSNAPAPTPAVDSAAPAANAPAMATRNKNMLRAIVIGPVLKDKAELGQLGGTKELPNDDLLSQVDANKVLVPPFDKLVMAMLPENNTMLFQCIEAMEINIDGFGHRLEVRVDVDQKDMAEKVKAEVLAERAKLINFFRYATQGISFTQLRRRTRRDIESTGEGFWEVIRTTNGDIVGFNHIPSYQISLGAQDTHLTPYHQMQSLVQPDGTRVTTKMARVKRFRRYIQTRQTLFARGISWSSGTGQVRFFKEYGDPRIIDNRTGAEWAPTSEAAELPEAHRASELIHWKIYSPRTPYGMPRFIGNLITIYGDRAADEVNFVTLRNNNIPSMAVMVSNGQLTDGTIKRITDFVETQIQGSDNYSRFLLIEGESQFEGGESSGAMKIDIKPLTGEQMRDQMFQMYGENNADKVRRCFRLPPIFVGNSDDYTRATAESSRKLADEQVFSPERDEFDSFMNDQLLPELGILYHDFWSNGPNVTDDSDLLKLLGDAEAAGGMTPKLARRVIADVLGVDEHSLPPLDPSVKPDVPFTLQVAEAVKNTAEPSHQLAVKAAARQLGFGELLSEIVNLRKQLDDATRDRRKRR